VLPCVRRSTGWYSHQPVVGASTQAWHVFGRPTEAWPLDLRRQALLQTGDMTSKGPACLIQRPCMLNGAPARPAC